MKEFTIKEAAEYLNKSESWIRKKILSNELQASKKPFKYGQRYKITKKALDELQNHIQAEREVIELAEIDKPISKEEILNELSNEIPASFEQLEKAFDDFSDEHKQLLEEFETELANYNENIESNLEEMKEEIFKGWQEELEKLINKGVIK